MDAAHEVKLTDSQQCNCEHLFVQRPGLRFLSVKSPLAVAAALACLLSSCSGDDPELTTEEILSEIQGRPLTQAEVDERQEMANFLCALDDAILIEIWAELEVKQQTPSNGADLEFQDFVFSRVCADRNTLYAKATGRFTVSAETTE